MIPACFSCKRPNHEYRLGKICLECLLKLKGLDMDTVSKNSLYDKIVSDINKAKNVKVKHYTRYETFGRLIGTIAVYYTEWVVNDTLSVVKGGSAQGIDILHNGSKIHYFFDKQSESIKALLRERMEYAKRAEIETYLNSG